MEQFKRIMSFVMAMVMVLSIVPAHAHATETEQNHEGTELTETVNEEMTGESVDEPADDTEGEPADESESELTGEPVDAPAGDTEGEPEGDLEGESEQEHQEEAEIEAVADEPTTSTATIEFTDTIGNTEITAKIPVEYNSSGHFDYYESDASWLYTYDNEDNADAVEHQITITNNTDYTLKFQYSCEDILCIKVQEKEIQLTDFYEVGKKQSVTLTLKIAGGAYPELYLSNFSLSQAAGGNTEFVFEKDLGKVWVNDGEITTGHTMALEVGQTVTVTAEAAATAQFLGWINGETGEVLSTNASYSLERKDGLNQVEAVFASASSEAWFYDSGKTHLYQGLDSALAKIKSGEVILAADGTLPGGDYTIPSGVTLLIPCDKENTLCTTEPAGYNKESKHIQPTAYRTLSMESGANITVAGGGAISVAGWQSAMQGNNGAPYGPVGVIDMASGSGITVNASAFLYAWGYIVGEGAVTINSAGTVYESFEVQDYRGGNATLSMQDNRYRVFPFSQYYVQNIHVPMKLMSGAKENAHFSTNVTMVGVQVFTMPFVGPDNCLFSISNGYIIKDYDESTDRMIFDVHGDVTVTPITTSIKMPFGSSLTIKTANYELPINGAFTIRVHNGHTVTVSQNLAMLPGAELIIDSGATVKLANSKKLFVYDLDDCGNFAAGGKLVPAAAGFDRTYTRTAEDLKDAKIVVNGTLDASAGYLYTTTSGADICSTNGGTIKIAKGTDTKTYQYKSGSEPYEIGIVTAKLQNADGSFRETANAAGTYTYEPGHGRWGTNHTVASLDTNPPVVENPLTCQKIEYKQGYYYCACGAYFSDAAGQNPVSAADVEIYINPHVPGNTLGFNDINHWYECVYGCGTPTEITTHVDDPADGEHTCDVCEAVDISACFDENMDYRCDDCNAICPSLDGHLQLIPDGAYSETNLWDFNGLKWETGYYAEDGWTDSNYSITIPISEGDQIAADSFGTAPNKDGEMKNGIRVTWFDKDGLLLTQSPTTVYSLYSAQGYLIAPEGAVAVNVPSRTDKNTVRILTLPHEPGFVPDNSAYVGHEKQIPADACAGTNLWEAIPDHDPEYYKATGWGTTTSYGGAPSLTIPVNGGDKIFATSMTGPGIRITWFIEDGSVIPRTIAEVQAEYAENGYLTAPKRAIAVCVPIYNNYNYGAEKELRILTLGHTYGEEWVSDKTGHWHACACGEKSGFTQHSEGDVCDVCGYEEEKINDALFGEHRQDLPAVMCAGTNLLKELKYDGDYFKEGNWTDNGEYHSLTFYVTEGDQLWATSFQKAGLNGLASTSSTNGIQITWFKSDGTYEHKTAASVYAEFAQNGYVSVTAGVVAVNVPLRNSDPANGVYILNKSHDYEGSDYTTNTDGTESRACGICGKMDVRPLAAYLSERIQLIPDGACASVNLWPLFERHDKDYFKNSVTNDVWSTYSDKWGGLAAGEDEKYTIYSVTIPIGEGDRIWATSFQAFPDNNNPGKNGSTSNAVRVTWFSADGKYLSWNPARTYNEFTGHKDENGVNYIEAPEGAVAVNIAMWSDTPDTALYILNRGHDDSGEWKQDLLSHWKECGCGEHFQEGKHVDNAAGDACDVCGYTYPQFYQYLSEIPEGACAGTNIWNDLTTYDEYYKKDGSWEKAGNRQVKSVVIPVKSDDRIYATSFDAGIRITWCMADGSLSTREISDVAGKEYLEPPANAVAVNIPIYVDTEPGLYIYTLPHNYDGEWEYDNINHWKVCACGQVGETESHTEGDVCTVCGYETEQVDNSFYVEYLNEIPADACGKTNLWPLLSKKIDIYVKEDLTWGQPKNAITSVVVPISPGDQIYASSFNSMRIAWFYKDGTKTTEKTQDNAENKEKGYISAPTNAVAVCVPIYNSTSPKEFYIYTLDHNCADTWSFDESGHWHACAACSEQFDFVAHTDEACTECGYVPVPNASEKSDYEDLVISIMGDSISTYAGWIPAADGFNLEHISRYPDENNQLTVEETWWHQLIFQELNAKLGVNESWRSTEIGNIYDGEVLANYYEGTKACMASMTRIQNLGSNGTPDMILFYGGTNDITQRNCSYLPDRVLGSFDASMVPAEVDLTTEKWDTIIEAYVTALMRMHHFYPDAKIVCMFPTVTSKNTVSVVSEYNAEFKKACDYLIGMGYDIFYVDLLDCGITASKHLPDGTHPNAEGMDLITAHVLNQLLKNCEMDKTPKPVYEIKHNLTFATADKFYYTKVSGGVEFTEQITGENLQVTVTVNGTALENAYDPETKLLRISNVDGNVEITAEGTRPVDYYYDGRLKQIPDDICAGTNLVDHPDVGAMKGYFDTDGTWNTSKNTSILLAVNEGDKLWASSFQAGGLNGTASSNGVRITWFMQDGSYEFYDAADVYKEFKEKQYIEVKENVVAVCVFFRDADEQPCLKVVSREHTESEPVEETRDDGKTYEVVYCGVCKEELSREEKVEQKELIEFAGTTMNLGNELAITFYLKTADLEGTDYYAVITKEYADGRDDVVVTIPYADWIKNGTAYIGPRFNGVAAKEMTDNIYVQIFNGAGEAVSVLRTDSVRAYAMRILEKTSCTEEEKTMIVDMLNYGAAAQDNFDDYHIDDLANVLLTDDQKAMATDTVEYSNNRDTTDAGDYYAGSTLVMENSILMTLYFRNITREMHAEVSFTDHYGKDHTYTVSGSEFKQNGQLLGVVVDKLVVADARQMVTVKLYNGKTLLSTVSDSIESYAARMNGELFETIMKLAESAYQMFH